MYQGSQYIPSFTWIQADSSNALELGTQRDIALKRKELIAFPNRIKLHINLLETSTGSPEER